MPPNINLRKNAGRTNTCFSKKLIIGGKKYITGGKKYVIGGKNGGKKKIKKSNKIKALYCLGGKKGKF